jgi:hypothetical protein
MAKLIFGMMQSFDGYVAGVADGPRLPPPGATLHRYFNDHVRDLVGSLYGRRMYEVMRYWDEDRPEWGALHHDFAAAWRAQPKWVMSRSLKSVGAAATESRHGKNVGRRDGSKSEMPTASPVCPECSNSGCAGTSAARSSFRSTAVSPFRVLG